MELILVNNQKHLKLANFLYLYLNKFDHEILNYK